MTNNKNNFLFQAAYFTIFISFLMLSGCAEGPDRDIEHNIFVTHAELNMIEGDEVQITASPTSQSFSWESSNADVATVSSTGLVKAVADGTCFIYVTSNEGLDRTIPVDVVQFIPLSGIEVFNTANLLTVETISVLLGQSISLGAKAIPENYNERVSSDVIWESKDESIVIIDENTGVLQAVNFGSTEIVVSAAEKPEVQKVIPIEVPTIPITDIIVSPSSLDLILEQTATLSTSFLPTSYSVEDESLVWSSSDPSIVEVTDGVVQANSPGQTTVKVSLNSDPTVFTEVSVSVEFPSVIDISKFKGTGLNDNLIYKQVYLEENASIDVQGLSDEEIAAAYNRDFMEWNPSSKTLKFTGETGQWDVYYSHKYQYFWIRHDERGGSTTDVYWLRGIGFTQAPVWHPDLVGTSGGYCWALEKIRFAAFMKPLGNNRYQASVYIPSAAQSASFWITIKHNLCAWANPPGTPLQFVGPAGFAASNTDINVRPDGFTGGYYRVTLDLNTNQRILEKID
ncbi:MAG: Ig-like domain-containing protein [Ruminiclostridium sp.]|jgi:uncharacterized protein YjdB|nr:Ig-like domain-containing protein [Ruminiclostridium sp.]